MKARPWLIIRLSAAGLAAMATFGCSDEAAPGPENQSPGNFASPPAAASPPAEQETRYLAGGGLAGLRMVPARDLLGQAETMRLMEMAYADAPGATGTIVRDGNTYTVVPRKAVRIGDDVVLLVGHGMDDAPHVAGGAVSIFYFQPGAQRPVRRFPFAIEAGSFGQEPQLEVVMLDNGTFVALIGGGGTWQGYTCSTIQPVLLLPTGIRAVEWFPAGYTDGGATVSGAATDITLVGMQSSADGRSLQLHYGGEAPNDDGAVVPVNDRHVFDLDGEANGWIQTFRYKC